MASRVASLVRSAKPAVARLADSVPRDVVDDIFGCALKKQTGVSLKYMLDFGANPIERQLILSAQFLHNELPVRVAPVKLLTRQQDYVKKLQTFYCICVLCSLLCSET